MNKKRLIITSVISIILVVILMLGSTYSLFSFSEDKQNLETNVYTTGNLNITYTVSDDTIKLEKSIPVKLQESKIQSIKSIFLTFFVEKSTFSNLQPLNSIFSISNSKL